MYMHRKGLEGNGPKAANMISLYRHIGRHGQVGLKKPFLYGIIRAISPKKFRKKLQRYRTPKHFAHNDILQNVITLEQVQERIWRLTWMSGNRSIHIVITIEEIPPQKIVTRHSVPLPAGATSSEDILVLHVLEHFEENGVWQQGGAPAFHRIILSSCALMKTLKSASWAEESRTSEG